MPVGQAVTPEHRNSFDEKELIDLRMTDIVMAIMPGHEE